MCHDDTESVDDDGDDGGEETVHCCSGEESGVWDVVAPGEQDHATPGDQDTINKY